MPGIWHQGCCCARDFNWSLYSIYKDGQSVMCKHYLADQVTVRTSTVYTHPAGRLSIDYKLCLDWWGYPHVLTHSEDAVGPPMPVYYSYATMNTGTWGTASETWTVDEEFKSTLKGGAGWAQEGIVMHGRTPHVFISRLPEEGTHTLMHSYKSAGAWVFDDEFMDLLGNGYIYEAAGSPAPTSTSAIDSPHHLMEVWNTGAADHAMIDVRRDAGGWTWADITASVGMHEIPRPAMDDAENVLFGRCLLEEVGDDKVLRAARWNGAVWNAGDDHLINDWHTNYTAAAKMPGGGAEYMAYGKWVGGIKKIAILEEWIWPGWNPSIYPVINTTSAPSLFDFDRAGIPRVYTGVGSTLYTYDPLGGAWDDIAIQPGIVRMGTSQDV